jgi:amidophosphoribosyltransferase
MADRTELIAANNSLEEMRDFLEVESLGFLSVPGLYRAIGVDYDPETPAFADHCFTGNYPTRLIDHEHNESSKERQLSLLD